MQASIVIDVGFGDSGKGLVTDYLVEECLRHSAAPADCLVVRFSGGHQAGHTVVRDGRRHVFSNFGAGSLQQVDSFYSRHTIIFAPAILLEHSSLPGSVRLYIDPHAEMATPYDIAWNQVVSSRLGHGTCGLGIGPTVQRSRAGLLLKALDLSNPWILANKLDSIRNYYEHLDLSRYTSDPYNNSHVRRAGLQNREPDSGLQAVDWSKVQSQWANEVDHLDMDYFQEQCRTLYESKWFSLISFAEAITARSRTARVIFEGSQGVLLDQRHGIYPHVTWAHTTSRNAWELIGQSDKFQAIDITYVSRTYLTRHGAGPLPLRPLDASGLQNFAAETNQGNVWQGDLRLAELDPALLQYALDCDQSYHQPGLGAIQKNLVISCLDQRPSFDPGGLLHSLRTPFQNVYGSYGPRASDIQLLAYPGRGRSP
ncbi:MAG: adenylosuccinate synthetase [Leptospiraceae bacterium]|nr:adenylosuccinate synthetase [Leptospiraceae bacterium]